MKRLFFFTLLIMSFSGQSQKEMDCNILPSSIEPPIPDRIKLKIAGNVKTIEVIDFHINKQRAYNYLRFDKNGFLLQSIHDEPLLEDNSGIEYNRLIKLRNKGVISNYNYILKNGLINNFTKIDSIFKIDSQQNLIIEKVEKESYSYKYNSNNQLINYKFNMYSTDTLAINSKKPVLDVNLTYEKDKIINVKKTYLSTSTTILKYEYNKSKTTISEQVKNGYTKTYLNCNLQKAIFSDEYSKTERLYDTNGNQLSENIQYDDGDSTYSYREYDEMNNLIIEQRVLGSKLKYVYQFDKYKNWTNKKMINTDNGQVIVESKRVITYYK